MIERPLYIAIEGPIGVGKTTLVQRLSERLDGRIVLEVVEENPFLADFYRDRERYAFQTQLFFLMSRFKQQQELLQADLFHPNIIADYHLLKDRIFAQLTLRDHELALYERVFRHHEFTGRSGTMVAYEGLGSIYWHMVAKLLLAVLETVQAAEQAGAPQPTLSGF